MQSVRFFDYRSTAGTRRDLIDLVVQVTLCQTSLLLPPRFSPKLHGLVAGGPVVYAMFTLPQTPVLSSCKASVQRCSVPAAPSGKFAAAILIWLVQNRFFISPLVSALLRSRCAYCLGKRDVTSWSRPALNRFHHLLSDGVYCVRTVLPSSMNASAQRPELRAGRMRNLVLCSATPSIPSTDPQADDVANMDDATKRWSKRVSPTCRNRRTITVQAVAD